jgi:hypothetical protein
MDHGVRLVARLDTLAPTLVVRGVHLRFPDHPLDVSLAEPAGGLDADLLLLPSRLPNLQAPAGTRLDLAQPERQKAAAAVLRVHSRENPVRVPMLVLG